MARQSHCLLWVACSLLANLALRVEVARRLGFKKNRRLCACEKAPLPGVQALQAALVHRCEFWIWPRAGMQRRLARRPSCGSQWSAPDLFDVIGTSPRCPQRLGGRVLGKPGAKLCRGFEEGLYWPAYTPPDLRGVEWPIRRLRVRSVLQGVGRREVHRESASVAATLRHPYGMVRESP